jgi:hypothetical protein
MRPHSVRQLLIAAHVRLPESEIEAPASVA